jgi:hypothetical protein
MRVLHVLWLLVSITDFAVGQGLPELPNVIGAWHAVGAPETHAGADLYTYMDGGAELYLEYGFQDMTVRFYERGKDQITVELYRMKDSGYGIFTILRSGNGEPVSVADAGFRSGYYVIFSSGNFFCAVTAQSEFSDAVPAAVEIGKAVAAQLPPGPSAHNNTEFLPAKDCLPNSEKVIAGPVSLRNVSDTLGGLFAGFTEGAAARYRPDKAEEVLAGVLCWPTAAQTAAAFKQAQQRAAKEKDFRATSIRGELSFYDFEGKAGLAIVSRNQVLFAIATESARLRDAITQLRR